jgi:hypothetical protein
VGQSLEPKNLAKNLSIVVIGSVEQNFDPKNAQQEGLGCADRMLLF